MEHIKSSGPAAYLLIEYQKEFELPLLKVLQENNTRWWSILIMMERILLNFHPITVTLAGNNQPFLILNNDDKDKMTAIVALLQPFKECGEKLSSENDVTISLIVPFFQILKQHLSPNPNDMNVIKEMKSKMLIKLNNRYTTDQLKCLTTCTLLDVRHKNDEYVKKDFHQLETGIKELLSRQEQQQSQHEIPATEGQEIENLSSIGRRARSNNNDSIFDYNDDDAVDEPIEQWDALECELRTYKSVKMSATQKE